MGSGRERSIPRLAKIRAPQLAEHLGRPRLYNLLDLARARPVVWMTAPAGAGKTTLAASYIAKHRLHCLWYQVDVEDGDPATFFYYLSLAAHQADPRKRTRFPRLTPEYGLGLPTFSKRFFERLFAHLSPPSLVVFDNCDAAPEDSPFTTLLAEGMSVIPEGINVLILSRDSPPSDCARLQASMSVSQLGWDELRFTEDEARQVVALLRPKDATQALGEWLYRRTGGWAAGLVLMLEEGAGKIGGEALDLDADDRSSRDSLFAYFAREVLERENRRVRRVLTTTALLPQISTAAARSISGDRGAARILAGLARRGYFTFRQAGRRTVYQFHPLFRAFLLARLEASTPGEALYRLRHKAAVILEREGAREDAGALFIALKDWNALIRLVLENAPHLMAHGRIKVLEGWLDTLPAGQVRAQPWLAFWKGLCRLSFDPREAREHFDVAYRLFDTANDPFGIWLSWARLADSYLYEYDDYSATNGLLTKLDDLGTRFPEFPSPDIEAQVVSAAVMLLTWCRPDHPDLPRWVARGEALLNAPSDTSRVPLGNALVLHHSWVGFPRRLEHISLLMAQQWKTRRPPPHEVALWHIGEAVCRWHMGEMSRCSEVVDEGLHLSREAGIHLWDGLLCAHGAYGPLSEGDNDLARGYMMRLLAAADRGQGIMLNHYHCLTGWTALNRGEFTEAVRILTDVVDDSIARGIVFPEHLNRIGLAQALFETGDADAARAQLDTARTAAERIGSSHLSTLERLTAADLSLREGAREAGEAALAEGLKLAARDGVISFYFWRQEMMSRLCETALAQDIAATFVRELVTKRGLLPTDTCNVDTWPWAVRVHTLGRFVVEVNGRSAGASRKVQRKPLELLKVLVAHGGRPLGTIHLSTLLWPDAVGDAAMTSLRSNVHRLRRLIGPEAVMMSDGQVRLDPRRVWVDLWATDRLLDEAERHGVTGEVGGERLAAAIGWYGGPFLGDEVAHWALAARDRISGRLLRLIEARGRALRAGGRPEEAIPVLEQGMAINPVAEGCFREAMRCHAALGRRAEALHLYRRLRQNLVVTLAILPGRETEALHEVIRRDDLPA